MNKGGLTPDGFTIVETLIVLAVTMVLFSSVVLMMTGRQRQAEFTQAAQNIQAEIQQVINNVSAGYYPNQGNFNCQNSGGNISITAGTTQQGQNAGCVFLGKVLQFGVSGDPQPYLIYTVAGLRLDPSSANPVTNLTATRPTVLSNIAGLNAEQKPLEYGLTLAPQIGLQAQRPVVVGLLGSLGTGSNGLVNSGAQEVNVVAFNTTGLSTNDETHGYQFINTKLQNGSITFNPASGVPICFLSGGTNQSALITIGSNGRELVANLDIRSNKTCS